MDEILGQEHAIALLRCALASDRIHHAWVFAGPQGTGKATTARAFAAVLLDPDARPNLAGEVAVDPDGSTARTVAAGTHPGLHVVTKELAQHSRESDVRGRKQLTIPVEVVREFLVEPAHHSTSSSGGKAGTRARAEKVFIIDEAELLALRAQNALLKTLEEPPAGTVIILVTSREHRLLPTIRSRVQRVRFRRLPDDAMARWLERQPGAAALEDKDRARLRRFAGGSPGRARLMIDEGLLAWYRSIEPGLAELASGRYPADLGGLLADHADAFAKRWVDMHANASKEAANKTAVRLLLSLLAEEAHRSLLEVVDRGLHRDAADAAPGRAAAEHHASVLDLLHETENYVESNVHLVDAMNHLVARWTEAARAARR